MNLPARDFAASQIGNNDVTSLFSRFSGNARNNTQTASASGYQEIQRQQSADTLLDRWPLLADFTSRRA